MGGNDPKSLHACGLWLNRVHAILYIPHTQTQSSVNIPIWKVLAAHHPKNSEMKQPWRQPPTAAPPCPNITQVANLVFRTVGALAWLCCTTG